MLPSKSSVQNPLIIENPQDPTQSSNTVLNIDQLHCSYNSTQVVKSASFALRSGEIGCLLGPSGCGKTTILRAIAGFQAIDHGQIAIENTLIASPSIQLPPEKRSIGMVFQDYALFPHLSVLDNVMFGLNKKDKDAKDKALSMLKTVKLEHLAKRFPHELSGGQQQRIALARALAPRPKLILLDEPFSNLDTELRRTLSLEVREILKAENTCAILVTHDQEEAFTVADKIGVMMEGAIQQWGTPYELYHQPTSRDVASFIGKGSFIPAKIESSHSVSSELGLASSAYSIKGPTGETVDLLIRPEDIVSATESPLTAEIIEKHFLGASSFYELKLPSSHVISTVLSSHLDFEVGDRIGIRFAADHIVTFEQE